METQVLKKFESYLSKDVYSCLKMKCWRMSSAECKLYNEINFYHCDGIYGNKPFSESDIVIKLEDACMFYKFLNTCYHKLLNIRSTDIHNCGFIRINGEAIVPYTCIENDTLVPLFYFEGEVDDVKPFAKEISGWDLSYLKFCCKTQGIKNILYNHENCEVVSLAVIKKHFPPNTLFEEYWPSEVLGEIATIPNVANDQQKSHLTNTSKLSFC